MILVFILIKLFNSLNSDLVVPQSIKKIKKIDCLGLPASDCGISYDIAATDPTVLR